VEFGAVSHASYGLNHTSVCALKLLVGGDYSTRDATRYASGPRLRF
jgi:hypothetical protein